MRHRNIEPNCFQGLAIFTKQQLASLETLTGQFNGLQAHADELKENYQLYTQKRDQAQIEDAE